MPAIRSDEKDFIKRITEIVEENISNDQFGVTGLANEVGMSRSNLLRKVKKLTNLSASQFIREVRLKQADKLLKDSSMTVSEIAYRVGFGSPSYFIKCYGDYFGHPPGDAVKNADTGIIEENISETEAENVAETSGKKEKSVDVKWSFILMVAVLLWFLFFATDFFKDVGHFFSLIKAEKEKSIAVLPFINDSSDSTNVYIINGLMESTLNNLQKIKDLRVISRTSVEKYRNGFKSTPEISKELNVTYIIEGSGQKLGDQILLNIQLIEAGNDKHLWSKQYKKETKDIFELQAEVARNIAEEIKAIITPEEEDRINKTPTNDLVAYDFFLKGLYFLNHPTPENLKKSIPFFLKAIDQDNNYARSYAAIAMSYYFLDEHQAIKKYSDSINYYADKALLCDPQLPQSLIAKALFYMIHEEYELAVPYFEKALEYNPNYDLVFLFLVDLYVNHIPNTEKYLEYALKGLELDLLAAYDSATKSYSYLHISNAFIQSGFIDEAEKYVKKSLEYLPGNLYAEYVNAYILYAKENNLEFLRDRLIETLEKDTNQIDVLQEVGKAFYYLRDYESAYNYYSRFETIKEANNMDVYNSEEGKMGVVADKNGLAEESEMHFEKFRSFTENDPSIYKHINLGLYYSYKGDTAQAIEHLKLFSEEENFNYWTILFTPDDPMVDNIKELQDFKDTFSKIRDKFYIYHEKIEFSLKGKGLL